MTPGVKLSLRFWVKPMLYGAQAFAVMLLLDEEGRERLANGLLEFIKKHGVRSSTC